MSKIPSVREMLEMVGEQMQTLRPQNKPSTTAIAAANASFKGVNSYMGSIRVLQNQYKLTGETPKPEFLQLLNGE
jgi:hypothetical protein